MKTIKHYTRKTALDFFARLEAFSAQYVEEFMPKCYRSWPSGNHHEQWADDQPIGAILHHTGGTSFHGTVRHFVEGQRASAHWVVSSTLDSRADRLRQQFELDGDIRAETVQVIDPAQHPAWHAGWVNRLTAGLEVRNAGMLRPWPKDPRPGIPKRPTKVDVLSQKDFFRFSDLSVDELDFYWWADGWTTPFRGPVTKLNGSFWETWSRRSVATVVTLFRYLNSVFDLDPCWLLGHHNVSQYKMDVVYPVPLHLIRHSVLYDRAHVDDLEWLSQFSDFDDDYQQVDDPWLMRELAERQADRAEEDLEGFDPRQQTGSDQERSSSRDALRLLGYHLPDDDPRQVRKSVRIYQRSRNLGVDGVIGPITAAALVKDLKKWRLG